jgi:uncharacterized protein
MPRIRIITDGKAGDLVQCLGVAEAIVASAGGDIEERIVRPRAPFALAMPWGPADPRDGAAIAPPYPDIAIASGRRAVASLRALKRRSPACFTVFLKDPRTRRAGADLVWVPEHDRLRGPNVIVTPTSPHRITRQRMVSAAAAARPEIMRLPSPRVMVMLGGASKDVAFGVDEIDRLCGLLRPLADRHLGIMVTPSRRSPPRLVEAVRGVFDPQESWIWDGTGANPYIDMLALADAFIVTADSVNMVGEAVATGRPVHVFEPKGLNRKIVRFLKALARHGAVRNFEGRLENFAYEPLDSTPRIAREILERYHRTSPR